MSFKKVMITAMVAMLLAGCGAGPANVGGYSGKTGGVPVRLANKQAIDAHKERVVLRIPGHLMDEVQRQLRDVRAEEERRNNAEGPFFQKMIGGVYPGPRRTVYDIAMVQFAQQVGLHVSVDEFRTELKELTYRNVREYRGRDLLVPFMARRGQAVSYYFKFQPVKMPRPQGPKAQPIPLKVRYMSNFGKNYDGQLE